MKLLKKELDYFSSNVDTKIPEHNYIFVSKTKDFSFVVDRFIHSKNMKHIYKPIVNDCVYIQFQVQGIPVFYSKAFNYLGDNGSMYLGVEINYPKFTEIMSKYEGKI